MEKQSDYDNDELDLSEEYFRKKQKGINDYIYFPLEESEPPYYLNFLKLPDSSTNHSSANK